MKAIRLSLLTALGLALALGSVTCGTSGGGGDVILPVGMNLSVKTGPNANAPEPYQLRGLTATTGDWDNIILTDSTTANEIITAVLALTNPSLSAANGGLPDELLLAIIDMAFDMGDITADPAISTANACPTWDSNAGVGLTSAGTGVLNTNTTGAKSQLSTLECTIFAAQSGQLTVTFGTAQDVEYGSLTFGEQQKGTLFVQGMLLPPSNPLDTACVTAGVNCRDIWVTITTADFASAADAITFNGLKFSAISGYIFSYDISQANPDLGSQDIYMTANLEMNGANYTLVIHLAGGLNSFGTNLESGVVDSSGTIWGYSIDQQGSSANQIGSRIIIYGNNGGNNSVCTFDNTNILGNASETPGDYTYTGGADAYTVGPDGQPGVATVDDDGDTVVDDTGELGFPGSDDVNTCNYAAN